MRHARYYLIFVLVSFCAFAQNRPGVDYFPQIGFFDFMVQYLHPPHGNSAQIELSVSDSNYYHPRLKELGITDIVTDWAEYKNVRPSSDPATDFFIHDMGFEWRDNGSRAFTPAGFLKSFGHMENKYSLRFGGTPVDNLSFEKNFGFSYLDGEDRSSYWCMTTDTKPVPNIIPETGDSVRDGANWVRRARVSNDDNGLLLWGRLPWLQFFFENMNYYIDIKVKKIPAGGSNPLLFKIVVCQAVENNTQPSPDGYYKKPSIVSESSDAPLANAYLEQYVYWNDITHAAGTYDWFRSNAFTINRQTTTQFYIVWYDQSDIYIDQIAMYNDKYKNSFITNTHDYFKNNVFQPLQTTYSGIIDSRFQDFYFDEPFMLTARARGKLQDTLGNMFSNRPDVQVNGATGSLPEYFLHFDNKYARESQNAPHKKYILFNMYPFGEDNMYDQNTVQNRLNALIKCSSLGSAHAAYGYNYAGLRASQLAAQQYDSDSLNDVPLFMTLQVHAEHELDANGNYVQNLDRGKRPPTKDEIFAMGHLSLAFGVKGFMYYMIPTRCEIWGDGTHWGTYGLFDEIGNPYDYVDKIGLWQNPEAAQVKNERFDAVKDFIASFKPYENTLLKLRWLDAKYWNETVAAPYPWIDSVQTSVNANFTNPDNEEMVQTGYFEEYSNLTGSDPYSRYIYIVNRRCNETNSSRYVKFTIGDEIISSFKNYCITDLRTGKKDFVASGLEYSVYLAAGHGTLLKIEPMIRYGGTLFTSETVPSDNFTIDTTLTVPDNVKLTVNAGTKLTFRNSGRLLVEDGELEVNGTQNNKVEFDFLSKNWSVGNGIYAYRTPLKIKNANIKNASCGIYSHISSGDTIDGVTVDNTHYGISLYYSYNYGADNTVIRNSQITNSQLSGITMVGSRPRLHDNYFENHDGKGVSAYTGSAPVLLDTGNTAGGNSFLNNAISVYSLNSVPILGYVDDKENYTGGNCFVEDATSLMAIVENNQTSYIDAYGNDWGAENPDYFRIELLGDIEVNTDGYNTDCSGIWYRPVTGEVTKGTPKLMDSGEGEDSVKTVLKNARKLIRKGQLRDALSLLTGVIKGQYDLRYKRSAVSLVPECFTEGSTGELKSTLHEIRGENGLFKPATMLLMNIDTENMDVYKQEILNSGNNKLNGAGNNSEEVMMAFNSLLEEKYNPGGVIDTSGKVAPLLAYLNGNHPGSEYTKAANLLFSELPEGNPANKPMVKQHPGGNKPETVVYEYNLYNNYPNPFNPETVIKFSLKEKSSVTLTVYSITGQKVVELVNGEMEKGFYEKKFDGTKLSSGVYIFRLSAQSLESTTFFTKTMKALLLK